MNTPKYQKEFEESVKKLSNLYKAKIMVALMVEEKDKEERLKIGYIIKDLLEEQNAKS